MSTKSFLCIMLLAVACPAFAQFGGTDEEVPPLVPDVAATDSSSEEAQSHAEEIQQDSRLEAWKTSQRWYGIALAIMFSVALLCIFVPMWNRGGSMSELDFKVYVVTLIVFAGLLLIVMGWSDQQLAPMFGLLGGLAGYVLGERSGSCKCQRSQSPQP
ncbi:MAG: hypothetical protein AB7G28_07865 [Pirellulales bacterium]